MAAMALTNAKLLERKQAADKDAAEYEEIERESCIKVGQTFTNFQSFHHILMIMS